MMRYLFAFMLCFHSLRCQLESFVHNGENSDIHEFSHSACIQTQPCVYSNGDTSDWICGSSILNQRIMLTAAHCVYGCTGPSTITVRFGSADRSNSKFLFVIKSDIHEDYHEYVLASDIALVKVVEPLPLSINVGRIAVYPQKFVPYGEEATVAGWGYIDELQLISSSKLQHISQKIMKRQQCEKALGVKIPKGTICGGDRADKKYVSMGDSGSALVLRNYIQAGLVSFKKSHISRSIVVYTDVGYYYDWIRAHALKLYCT